MFTKDKRCLFHIVNQEIDMRKEITVYSLVILVLLAGCNTSKLHNKTKFTFGLSNYSYQIKKVDIQVYLNGEKLIDKVIVHDPKEEVFQFRYPPGIYRLKAVALKGEASTEHTFKVSKSDTLVGIFVGFSYHKPDEFDNIPKPTEIDIRIACNGRVIKDWN